MRMREVINAYKILSESLKEIFHVGDVDFDV
jgi:hypothetical protein